MIPLQITLKNFLSYRSANLDFRGLHTACICGANGAGKSSLLEAITWVVWGKTRAGTEDDVIHGGEKNVRVDFEFICNNQTYKIIRSRTRKRSSSLEFQIGTDSGDFKSLSAKGLKNTQTEINSCLKLDYETFINSAYLKQGRSDEFMLRRPNERKKILADLLKLEVYEELANKAKDKAKEYKGKVELLDSTFAPLLEQIEQKKSIHSELKILEKELQELDGLQKSDRDKLKELQGVESKRDAFEQQYLLQKKQYDRLVAECDRSKEEIANLEKELRELSELLDREENIISSYQELEDKQKEEQEFANKLESDREFKERKDRLERELLQEKNNLDIQLREAKTRLETIEQQEAENNKIISKEKEIKSAVEKLETSRQRLKELDEIQKQISPLLQEKNKLNLEISKSRANITAKLDQLSSSVYRLENEISRVPVMRKSVLTVEKRIEDIDKKRIYQKRLEDKGLEKKKYRERLQENNKIYDKQWHELEQKIEMLSVPDAICPLCERGLEQHIKERVISKTKHEQENIKERIWTIREELTKSDRDLQKLRQEYHDISEEISDYDNLRQQLGHLIAQLESVEDFYDELEKAEEEKNNIERSLATGDYASNLQFNLQQIEEQLTDLQYDEETHGLIRGEVERYRWAEIKYSKIEDAKKRQAKLNIQKPELLSQIELLEKSLSGLDIDSHLKQQITEIERSIVDLGYDRSEHQNILKYLRENNSTQLNYQQLQKAKEKYPQVKQKHQELTQILQIRLQDCQSSKQQLDQYQNRDRIIDCRTEIKTLETTIQQRRDRLDSLIANSGRLKESLSQIDQLEKQHQEAKKTLQETKHQQTIYENLAEAYGKNGIQALTIENILPQLEAETNQILARLTGNQFHVQFLTQRVSKSGSKKSAKLIDTLDILIADAGGTRPYETYSGGEAFRINFSIRLALAKLLSQRAGTALQLLIIDEGFGTQDSEGCDRLVAAINAISSDFSCILAVTHMPQFKEAFQTRIEVYKTDNGSILRVAS